MDITYYKKYEPIFGSWHIVREIGEGSFGKVFEIEREDFGQTYRAALKAITIPQNESELKSSLLEFDENEESVTSYYEGIVGEVVSEFALMSRLKGHSNVVSYEDHAVYRHGEGIGWDILIRMELLTPLLDYMRSNEMDRDMTVRLGIDMCRALEQCKKQDIIHRDIKPENIFISEFGDFKLGDFGIARVAEKTTGGMSKKGTYTYMAPEVYKGEAYGASVDIYSLGLVLYRLLNSSRAPFLPQPPEPINPSARESALMRRIGGEKIPAPAKADKALADIILKACAYNPKDRFSSPTEMRKALEAVAAASEDEAVPAAAEADSEEKTVAMKPAAPAASEKTAAIMSEAPTQKEAVAVGVSAAKKKLPAAEKASAEVKSPDPAKKAAAEKQRSSFSVGQALCAFALVVCLLCGIFGAVSSVNKPETVVTKLEEINFGELDVATAWDAIAQIEDGIAQLKENEQTYLSGVETYVAGKEQLDKGQKQLDANSQTYLEGKELIAEMESLMPAIQGMASAVQNVRDFNKGTISGDADQYLGNLRASVNSFLANTQAVAALSNLVGMDISSLLANNPTDTSIVGNIVNMYYDGLAQLKQYEDGLLQLADGKAQLAEGDAQLSQFEDGEAQIADGIMQLMMNMAPAYRVNSNEQIVDSLAERLAEELDTEIPELYNKEGLDEAAYEELCNAVLDKLYQQDAKGNFICAERDGKSMALLDLDRCGLVVENAEQYLDDLEAAMYDAEVNGTDTKYTTVEEKGVSTAALLICALLGLAAGVLGMLGKSVPAVIAGFAAAIGAFAVKPFFTGNNYPMIPLSANITPDLMLVAIAVSAAISLCVGAVKLVNKRT